MRANEMIFFFNFSLEVYGRVYLSILYIWFKLRCETNMAFFLLESVIYKYQIYREKGSVYILL